MVLSMTEIMSALDHGIHRMLAEVDDDSANSHRDSFQVC